MTAFKNQWNYTLQIGKSQHLATPGNLSHAPAERANWRRCFGKRLSTSGKGDEHPNGPARLARVLRRHAEERWLRRLFL